MRKEHLTSKQAFRHLIFLITYTIILVWIILHVQEVAGAIWMVIDLLKPFIYGIVMAFIFHLPMQFFMDKLPDNTRFKKAIAALLSLFLIIGVIAFIFWIVVPQVVDNFVALANAMPGYIDSLEKWIAVIVEDHPIPSDLWKQIEAYAQDFQQMALSIVKNGLPHLISMASGFASGIANFFMAIVIAAYITISKEKLQRQLKEFLYAFTSSKVNAFLCKVGNLMNTTFSNFVSGQLVEAIIIGVLCYIGCLILKFPYAPILSVIIGCTNIIPIFGAIFGVGLSALLVAFDSPVQGIFFILFGIFLQQFESNLIYPRVVGNTVGLSGLWVLFSITVGGGLFGIVGMVLGLPIFSIIYSLLREEMHHRSRLKKAKEALATKDTKTLQTKTALKEDTQELKTEEETKVIHA